MARPCARMDQYKDSSQPRVLWIDHTDRDRVSDDGEGHDETSVFRRQLDVSGHAPVSPTLTYEASVLTYIDPEVMLWASL